MLKHWPSLDGAQAGSLFNVSSQLLHQHPINTYDRKITSQGPPVLEKAHSPPFCLGVVPWHGGLSATPRQRRLHAGTFPRTRHRWRALPVLIEGQRFSLLIEVDCYHGIIIFAFESVCLSTGIYIYISMNSYAIYALLYTKFRLHISINHLFHLFVCLPPVFILTWLRYSLH